MSSGPTRLIHITAHPYSLVLLRGQLDYMKRNNFEIGAISSPDEYLERFSSEQKIGAYPIEIPRRITPLRDMRAVSQIAVKLRALNPAIVHAHTPKGGLLGLLGAAAAGVPIRIYHMRGLPMMTAEGNRRRLLRYAEIISCRLAHQVFCVSHSLRDVAIAEGLCSPTKIKVLGGGSGNGVDSQHQFNPDNASDGRARTRARHGIPARAIVIGFVGRLVRDKGVIELLDAWRALSQRNFNVHLLIIGQLDERDNVPPSVLEMIEAHPRIHWKGPEWSMPEIYAAMDIVALPTYREGFPNVALEAQAMRLPIVATRVPGCTDAIDDGETGILVPPRDSAALCSALERYLSSSALRDAHGTAGRERVQRLFRQEAIWQALYEEYCGLLHRYGYLRS
jgi:glycosyltransferase involved in cell wall biosynthesis